MCKKRNNHVLHDIEKLTESKSGLSEEFNVSNFGYIIEKYENDLKDFGKVCILNAHLEIKGKTLNGVCLEIFWNYFKKNQNSKDRIH